MLGENLKLIVSWGRKFSKSKSEILRSLQIRSISHRRENSRVQTSCRSCSKSANKNSIYHFPHLSCVPSGKVHHRGGWLRKRGQTCSAGKFASLLLTVTPVQGIHTQYMCLSAWFDSLQCRQYSLSFVPSNPPSNPTQLLTFLESRYRLYCIVSILFRFVIRRGPPSLGRRADPPGILDSSEQLTWKSRKSRIMRTRRTSKNGVRQFPFVSWPSPVWWPSSDLVQRRWAIGSSDNEQVITPYKERFSFEFRLIFRGI